MGEIISGSGRASKLRGNRISQAGFGSRRGRDLPGFGFPWRCDFARGEVLVGCSYTSNSGAAARAQRLKPQAKSVWSSGF